MFYSKRMFFDATAGESSSGDVRTGDSRSVRSSSSAMKIPTRELRHYRRPQPEPNNGFGIVTQVIDDNHFSVSTNWGHLIEVAYYRTDVLAELFPGNRVFVERLSKSQEWMITCHAFGSSSSGGGGGGGGSGGDPNGGWFEVDNDVFGLVDGPGHVMP
jgi:hypothetical protein